MKRPWIVPVALVALLAALVWLGAQRVAVEDPARTGKLTLAARVRVEEILVLAPSSAATRTASAGAQPAVAGLLTSVTVSAGDRINAGDIIARLDGTALSLKADQARAAARGARARVGIADDGLDTIADNSAKLSDARRKLDEGLANARKARAEVVANLEQARALARSAPPVLPPGMPDPRALVAKLEGALSQIDAGIAKALAGRAKLSTASAKLSDARTQLRGMRGVLSLAADAADAGVAVADARRALAAIRAPYSGLVTWAAEPGTVVFAGGPVARIIPDGPIRLDTYVDDQQVKLIRIGAKAEAGADSWPGRTFAGRVSEIRPLYEYPPTALATSLIHMTRAFRVTVEIDDPSAPLPLGTPADLTILARSE